MTRQDKHQKRRQQNRRATLRGIAWIALALFIGAVIGSCVTAAFTAEPPQIPQDKPLIAERIPPPPEPSPSVEEPEQPEAAPPVYLGEFTVTHYCCEAYAHICGTGDGLTATGTEVTAYRSCAVDPDVIPLGSELQLHMADGRILYCVAEDTGGAIQGNKIDLALPTHAEALAAGVTVAGVYVIGGQA